jgi:adenosylcobinamide kinase/adenosylcobinamide-phosphate guanylyltransferase
MAQLTLVLGGVRSGKSRWAEQLTERHSPVTYLATAQAGDAEMAARIAAHRQRRPPSWRTVEEPWQVAAVVARQDEGCLLLECVPLWLTNRLAVCTDVQIRAEVADLVEAVGRAAGRVIVVSNETGCGIMPDNALARRFGDLLGEANQQLAAAAQDVYWCVAGIPVCIKGDADMR